MPALSSRRLRRCLAAVSALLVTAAGPAVPATSIAGRYTYSYPDPFTRKKLGSVVEIVPVGSRHAYVRFSLSFHSGFSCGLAGIARAERNRLVYREPRRTGACRLVIRREGADLTYDDGNSCKHHCGMNAELTGSMAWKSRRPIRYLARLRRSREYAEAMAAWRADGEQ